MAFGFTCPDLTGQNQTIGALETPAFVRTIDVGGAPGSRVWFQGVAPGVAPYASSTVTRAAMSAGLVAAGADFTPVDFLDLDGVTVTVNGDGEIASIVAIAASLLPIAVPAACRLTFSSGIYCDVQGTVAAVTAALSAGGGGTAPIVGPQATIYVEPPAPLGRGNDATGQRGNAARPFATLNGALGVMLSGDTIDCSSGVYAPPTLPIPPSILQGVIRGADPAFTVIDAQGTGLPCLDLSGTARDLMLLKGFRFQQDPGVDAIRADGTGASPGTFFTSALAIADCTIAGGDLLFRYCGTLILQNVTDVVQPGTLEIIGCRSSFLFSHFSIGRDIVIDQDNDDPNIPPGSGPLEPVRFIESTLPFGSITLRNQGGAFADEGTTLPDVTADTLTISVGTFLPSFVCFGSVVSVDFGTAPAKLWPDANSTIDLTGVRCGNVNVASTPGATSTVRVELAGAVLNGPANTFGEAVIGNLRTASVTQGLLVAIATAGSNGRIIPPTFATLPELVQAPPLVSSFSIPFRMASIDYAVALDYDEPDGPGSVPSTRNQTSFDVLSTNPTPSGASSVRCIVSFYGN